MVVLTRYNATNNIPEIRLVGKFFDEYSQEVKEHLAYEDVVAFPYFSFLAHDKENVDLDDAKFSAEEYRQHHTDIETKLGELKNLLLKHISPKTRRFFKAETFNKPF